MFSEGAIPVIDHVCRVIVPLAGMGGWLLGWLLHGLGGPTRPFLWFGVFAVAIVPGWVLTDVIGTAEAGLASSRPLVDLIWVVVPFLVIVGLLVGGRRRAAGVILIGMALPWVLIFCSYVVDLLQGPYWSPENTFGQLAAGLVALAAGTALALVGDPIPAPDPESPPGRPGSRRTGSMTRHLFGGAAYGRPGPAILLPPAAWVMARLTFGGSPAVAVAAALLALALASEVELRWMPRDVLGALEAFHEIGLAAMARFRVEAGRAAPSSPAGWAAWLASTPETPVTLPARVEILTALRRWDEAEAALERVDPTTPADAFRKAALAADLVWRRGGAADVDGLRARVVGLGPPGDPARTAAEGQLAWYASEVSLAALEPDWKRPLLAFRATVPLAAGLHARSMRRRAWQQVVIPMALVILAIGIADGMPGWRG